MIQYVLSWKKHPFAGFARFGQKTRTGLYSNNIILYANFTLMHDMVDNNCHQKEVEVMLKDIIYEIGNI